MDWLENISTGAWTAIAAWLAVVVGIAALLYAWRQYKRVRQQSEELMQPNVAMFMEPAAGDWHLIELVVKNFGRTPAYGIRFDFAHPPTVGKYEDVYDERYVDIVPLNLPAEIPYLAPAQEWRIVWDSALGRRELGESIASRFDGAVTYYDRPSSDKGRKRGREQLRSTAVLDWSTLHPVERLELLTTHDLARQEKQKLELLRHLLTYYHYAAAESREDVLRREINQVRAAAEELRDRYRDDVDGPARPAAQVGQVGQVAAPRPAAAPEPARVPEPARAAAAPAPVVGGGGAGAHYPPAARPPANVPANIAANAPAPPPGDAAGPANAPGNAPVSSNTAAPGHPQGNAPGHVPDRYGDYDDYDETETQVINGRHRHRLT